MDVCITVGNTARLLTTKNGAQQPEADRNTTNHWSWRVFVRPLDAVTPREAAEDMQISITRVVATLHPTFRQR
eukprot:COSAG01_NODE_28650_length_656_cov_1.068223_1_plen_72_part_10